MGKGQLHIGTSGWSYKHWKGIFYPEKMASGKYLEFYISQFDCTELNASFYRLPNKKTIESWNKQIPENFRLALKLSRQITHYKRLKDTEDELSTFFDLFKPLQNKLGPVLIQLPPSLKFNSEVVESFFIELNKNYSDYTFALEARNSTWFAEEAISLTKKYGIGWTIAESGGRFPQSDAVTSDIVYLRFHGPKNPTTTGYSEKELSLWAKKTRAWIKKGLNVWAFFNNDTAGHAVMNARTFRELTKI